MKKKMFEELVKKHEHEKPMKLTEMEELIKKYRDVANTRAPDEEKEYKDDMEFNKKRARFQRIMKKLKGSDALADLHAKNFNK